jgi:hypothetical protein
MVHHAYSRPMDVVSIAMGVAMFAILLVLIRAIERI